MTEAEWLGCANPSPMLSFLRDNGHLSERKARLFVVASCRWISPLLSDERSQRAIEVAEQYLEGGISQEELYQVRLLAHDAYMQARASEAKAAGHSPGSRWAHRHAAALAFAAYTATCCDTPGDVDFEVECILGESSSPLGMYQPGLFRDIFGNPFRRAAIPPTIRAWNDGTAVKLAGAIYEERAFDRLPILADALEEAGCTDAELLAHLRGPRPHVRGCWAVDAILDRK
jgi:hypothetical protein